MTRTGHALRRNAAAGAVAAAAVALNASPAAAHAKVVSTSPAAGTTTGTDLSSVVVRFDDPVRLVPRALVVTGATGAPQPIGAARVVGGRTLMAPITGGLIAGHYLVGWRVLSDDGHIESGSFGFTVSPSVPDPGAGAAPSAVTTPPAPGQPVWPVLVAAGLAVAAAAGAGLVVRRGLQAVRLTQHGAYVHEPVQPSADQVDGVSEREHTPSRR